MQPLGCTSTARRLAPDVKMPRLGEARLSVVRTVRCGTAASGACARRMGGFQMHVFGRVRANALWGRRGGGQRRSNGSPTPGIRTAAAMILVALAVPLAASAGSSGKSASAKGPVVEQQLLARARANPAAILSVIVQGRGSLNSAGVANKVARVTGARPGVAGVKRQFRTVNGVSAQLTGAQLLALAADPSL